MLPTGKYAQHFHLMPPLSAKTGEGWLNDPNGLCVMDGVFHIFFQYSPDFVGGQKSWGHCTTRDLLHYQYHPQALLPDTPADADGAYSGSALVRDGELHLFYTGNVKHPGDHDYIFSGREHNTISVSSDGHTFSEKKVLLINADYPADLSCHVRDPKVFERDGRFWMVLGARTKDDRGCLLLYVSDNLQDWSLATRLTKEGLGYMWECPDMITLDGHNLLLFCPQGMATQGYKYENIYQNGWLELTGVFPEGFAAGAFTELDYGFDFYAPQSFVAGERTLLIGWMGLPDADYSNDRSEGWQHCLTIPRELSWEQGRIFQRPLRELEQLRGPVQPVSGRLELEGNVFELRVQVEGESFALELRRGVSLGFASGLLTLSFDGEAGLGRTSRHLQLEALSEVQIFSDSSSLEIFINGGFATMTTRVFSAERTLHLKTTCEATLCYLDSFTFNDEET